MNKSDKIREYFRKYPSADVAKVATKFQAPKPMTYKLRKQVIDSTQLVTEPAENGRKVTVTATQLAIAKKLGVKPEVFIREGLKQGVLQYDDERDFTGEGQETDIDETLDERAKDYGKFKDSAALMQGIKRLLADHALRHNKTFADDQWEALEMIVHKMARIVNGNSDKVDSWVDIAGYATLIADRLQGNAR